MTTESQTEPTDEQIALSLGWHPEEEFNGDPKDFVDAEEFVKRGQRNFPVLQSNVKTQATRIEKLEKIVEQQKAFNERNLTSQRESMQAAYDKELARIVEDGDSEAFKNLKKPEIPETPQATAPEMDAFVSDNPWYGTDSVMTASAHAISSDLMEKFPGFTLQQNLDKTMIRMKDEFPHKLGNGKIEEEGEERIVARVEGGRRIQKKKSGQTYSDLDAESKVVCDNFIKEGIIKSREDYVKSYDWSA